MPEWCEPGVMQRIATDNHHKSYKLLVGVIFGLFLMVAIAISTRVAGAEPAQPVGAAEHVITVHDDGVEKGFYTHSDTLGEALAEAGIRIDPKDRTEPGLNEELVAASYEVNIYRARPVLIRDGSHETKVLTAYRTGKQIASEGKIALNDADKVELSPSRDPIADGAAEIMTITRALPFTFVFYGKTETSYTLARTVGDMLKEKNINMSGADGISPSLSTPITAGMTVKLWREGTQTVTVEEDVAFPTRQIKDANRDKGYKEVQEKGENGRRTVTYEINTQNGVEVSRKEINSNVTKQPVEQVEIIGTKVNLPPGSHEDWMAAAGIAPGDYGYVNYIFSRESGWRPNAVSPNGYYGLGQTNYTKISSACPNWESDPICQIRLFDAYKSRYGTWYDAYEFWLSHHWW